MFKFGSEKFTKKQLPKNFADQILNLEMEVELNEQVPIQQLQDLVSLYMIGVEYYESIKDRRHTFFQKKLNALMVKPSFINTTTKIEEAGKPSQDSKRAKFEEESRRIELDLIYSQTESKEAQVKGIVENHTNCVKQIESIIQHDIAAQSDVFQQRLERRRKSKLAYSHSQPEIDLQSQKSGNSNNQKKKEAQEQINQIKQVIHEEDENTAMRKDSIKWIDKKQRTLSIQNKRRSVLLTTKQLTHLLDRRSQSSSKMLLEYSKEQILKDQQRINQLFRMAKNNKQII